MLGLEFSERFGCELKRRTDSSSIDIAAMTNLYYHHTQYRFMNLIENARVTTRAR